MISIETQAKARRRQFPDWGQTRVDPLRSSSDGSLRHMSKLESVCVFLGSSTGDNPANAAATVEMGEALAERGLRLVYGGGNAGLMGLLANTVLAAGGEVFGVIPQNLFTKEVTHRGLTELIETATMHERKALMYEASDAFAALPGGMGTLDELAEVSTWRQIRVHDKPVGVVNTDGYYDDLLRWFDRVIADGLMSANSRSLLHTAGTPGELLDLFEGDQPVAESKWDS